MLVPFTVNVSCYVSQYVTGNVVENRSDRTSLDFGASHQHTPHHDVMMFGVANLRKFSCAAFI